MKYDFISRRRTPDIVIKSPDQAYEVLKKHGKKQQEHFFVLTLDSSGFVKHVHIVTIGIVNKTLVHPREIFIKAIKDSSTAIIVVHNHTSGSCVPSDEDVEVTRKLRDAGNLIGISVLDHLIFTKNGYYSFQEAGKIL